MSKQFTYDETGKPQFVVLPVDEDEKLISETESCWESIPIEAGEHDDESVPHEMVVMLDQDISPQAAWRVYRQLSQQYVAEQLGTTQRAILHLERKKE